MDQTKEKLMRLDQKSQEFLQDGKYLECLDVMEEALNIRRVLYGEDSDEYYKTSEKLCELCNMLSMIFLQKEKFDATFEFLKKAEVLGQNSMELKAITYNNMACYYRRIGKLRTALTYLQKALEIETKLEPSPTLADTHLNICAVYSQIGNRPYADTCIKKCIGKHDQAKDHVMHSILLLQEEFLLNTLPKKVKGNNTETAEKKEKILGKTFEDRMAVLAIAYHNLGVEYEYLKQYDEAIQTYKKAVNFAKNYLGEQNQIVDNLNNVLATAQAQIEENRAKTKQRKMEKDYGYSQKGTTQNIFSKAKSAYGTKDSAFPKKNTIGFTTTSGYYNIEKSESNKDSQSYREGQKAQFSKERQSEKANPTTNFKPSSKMDPSTLNQSLGSENDEQNNKKWSNIMTPRNISEDSKESDEKTHHL